MTVHRVTRVAAIAILLLSVLGVGVAIFSYRRATQYNRVQSAVFHLDKGIKDIEQGVCGDAGRVQELRELEGGREALWQVAIHRYPTLLRTIDLSDTPLNPCGRVRSWDYDVLGAQKALSQYAEVLAG